MQRTGALQDSKHAGMRPAGRTPPLPALGDERGSGTCDHVPGMKGWQGAGPGLSLRFHSAP